jgi:hypothetical protein
MKKGLQNPSALRKRLRLEREFSDAARRYLLTTFYVQEEYLAAENRACEAARRLQDHINRYGERQNNDNG